MEPFLATFFEARVTSDFDSVLGTQTETRIENEAPDSDPDTLVRTPALGTQIVTEIHEQLDVDPAQCRLGTETFTKVTNEAPDDDVTDRTYGLWEVRLL